MLLFVIIAHPPPSTLFPYTTLFRSRRPAREPRRRPGQGRFRDPHDRQVVGDRPARSEEHTSELQSLTNLVCRLLLEKKRGCRPRHTAPSLTPPYGGRRTQTSPRGHR